MSFRTINRELSLRSSIMFLQSYNSKITTFLADNGLYNGFYDTACQFNPTYLVCQFRLNTMIPNFKKILVFLRHRDGFFV